MKLTHAIHIGIDSASIAKMKDGEPCIIRTDTLRDEIPMCVYVNKKGAIQVGDSALNAHKRDALKSQKGWNSSSQNSFVEFTRTLGTDKTYFSSNANKAFTSEELLAEVLKTLIAFEKDVYIKAAVLTVPASYEMNQISATKKASELAGLEYVELVQEPVAAAMAFGLETVKKDGFWLVFDFGGGTFDATLIKVSDGIIKVVDHTGDNYLGGKNLDEAIVDQIFIPYLKENFTIDSIIENQEKFTAFKEMWKSLAVDAKNQLSYEEEYPIITSLYDEYGEDDEGEEFEIDLTVTREQLKEVIEPFIQKAIDYCQILLKQNNIDGNSLGELVLVGAPTLSPIIRKMLEEQIKKPNTSIEPETVIVKGAAIYASTINNPIEEIPPQKNKTVQLIIDYDTMVVDEETFISLKTKEDNRIVFVEIERDDNTFKSEKVEVNNIGEVIELALVDSEKNIFKIRAFDKFGNKLNPVPNSISIIHGGLVTPYYLPHSICVEVIDLKTKRRVLKAIKGLEKDRSLPAVGTWSIKIEKNIRPSTNDFIDIPIYQGIPETKAINNNHVTTVQITGEDIPTLISKGSIADLTFAFSRGNDFTGKIYFPAIDFEMALEINSNESEVTKEWLAQQIRETENSLRNIDTPHSSEIEEKLNKAKNIFESKNTEAGRLEARSELQKVAREIEQVEKLNEWPNLEETLKDEFYRLEKANNDLENEKTTQVVSQFRSQLDEVIRSKDVKLGNVLLEEINGFLLEINRIAAVNEKYDREYLQLYENGEMSLIEVKDSLEEANRQEGIVYQEVLNLINKEERRLTKDKVEDLLFALTENESLPSAKFGEYFERLSNIQENSDELDGLFTEIKGYE